MLVTQGVGNNHIAFGRAIPGSASTAALITHNGFGLAIDNPNLLAAQAVAVLTTANNASTAPSTGPALQGLELTWGRWNKTQIQIRTNPANNTTDAAPNANMEWAVFKPANMAGLTGTFRYGNSSLLASSSIDQTGAELLGGIVEFDVNLAGGPFSISNGLLQIFDSTNATWRVTFNGTLNGAFATMTDIIGFFGTAPVTGSLGGVFIGTGTTPDFVGGFSLQSGFNFVQGIALLDNENCFSCAP
jgi:hypothetical protein